MQNLKLRLSNFKCKFRRSEIILFCILHFAFCIGCSIPNLEKPECAQSRDSVKEFYSYHFGSDMKFTPENLHAREKYLTPEFSRKLGKFMTQSDPFTLTEDFPKAFSISGCNALDANKTAVRVLLFWRDDTRSEQREIYVETAKGNGKWLINNIYNEQTNLESILNH